MTKIICITGNKDHGKTNTVAMVYQKLLDVAAIPVFANKKVETELDYSIADKMYQKNRYTISDFNALLPLFGIKDNNVCKKLVGFVCQGDPRTELVENIKREIDLGADVIVCAARRNNSYNRYNEILEKYGNEIVREFPIDECYSQDENELFSIKKPLVDKIIKTIQEEIGDEYFC